MRLRAAVHADSSERIRQPCDGTETSVTFIYVLDATWQYHDLRNRSRLARFLAHSTSKENRQEVQRICQLEVELLAYALDEVLKTRYERMTQTSLKE